eukprot:m.77793 g.77793  ORF g.77793 m.77793 type:complete len:208 (+) comp20702_c0_seq4:143-766(+)
MTASWDRTCKFWDLRQAPPVQTIVLPDRAYAADVSANVGVIATADKKIAVLRWSPIRLDTVLHSALRLQSRCICIYPAEDGFAVGSVEGRCNIQYFNPGAREKQNFCFKCHRQDPHIYPVHGISFHPNGNFATCGGDSFFVYWDKDKRTRLKLHNVRSGPITCGAFNFTGDLYAFATSADFSLGPQTPVPTRSVYVTPVPHADIRKK